MSLETTSNLGLRNYWIDLGKQTSPEIRRRHRIIIEEHLGSPQESTMSRQQRRQFNADNLRRSIPFETRSTKRSRQVEALKILEKKGF